MGRIRLQMLSWGRTNLGNIGKCELGGGGMSGRARRVPYEITGGVTRGVARGSTGTLTLTQSQRWYTASTTAPTAAALPQVQPKQPGSSNDVERSSQDSKEGETTVEVTVPYSKVFAIQARVANMHKKLFHQAAISPKAQMK